jgi:hypothetical protein
MNSDDELDHEPSNMLDNPDIEFLPPAIPIETLAACIESESEPIGKRCVHLLHDVFD